jgi:Spy/CpxP family protein refolding chaperone
MNDRFTSTSMRRLLALATLAAAGSAASTAVWAAGPGGRGPDMPMGAMGMMGTMGGPGLTRALEQVGATADQRSQIEQIHQAARADLRAGHEQGRALHEQMRELFLQPEVDATAVESLRQRMMARHDQASQRMTQAMLDVGRVLSAEQRQQLAELMKQRSEHRHGERGEHRRGERPGA